MLGSATLALIGCGAQDEEPADTGAIGTADLDTVAFALGLERLESAFYGRVLEGGRVSGEARRLVERVHRDEREHVEALTGILRQNRRRLPPAPELGGALLASGSEQEILSAAARVEDLGANAYAGAARDILDRNILKAALSIHSVEARHASALHRLLGEDFAPEGAFAAPLRQPQVLDELQGLLA